MNNETAQYYKDLMVEKSANRDKLKKAISVAEKFIKKHKLIIVGGQSIDYALRIKNHTGIYKDSSIPDLDVVSCKHHYYAYNLALNLSQSNITGISVINALHPSTMKVRVDFQDVMDITYVPEKIEECMPTLWYKGYHIIHPHYQYIDQHRSLSYPYENSPYENILNRLEKDITRYELLYKYYPMRILYTIGTTVNLKDYMIPKAVFLDQCINGFMALSYWVMEAKKMGFKTDTDIGKCDFKKLLKNGDMGDNIHVQIPNDINGITIYSDNMEDLYKKITGIDTDNAISPYISDSKTTIFFERFLDKLPRKIIIDNIYELFDNNQMITAHKASDRIYISNIQHIMTYILVNYIILTKMSNTKKSYAYYAGYMLCRSILEWASGEYKNNENNEDKLEQIMRFLPTTEYYGIKNINDSYVVANYKFEQKNDPSNMDQKDSYSQPKHMYDKDLFNKKSIPKYFDFDIKDSEIYNVSGNTVQKFY